VHQQWTSALISAVSHFECTMFLGSGAALIHTIQQFQQLAKRLSADYNAVCATLEQRTR